MQVVRAWMPLHKLSPPPGGLLGLLLLRLALAVLYRELSLGLKAELCVLNLFFTCHPRFSVRKTLMVLVTVTFYTKHLM